MEPDREQLFDVLVREHRRRLSAYLKACIHHRELAEDLTQEAFVAAWENFDQYDRSRPFAAWLRAIARQKIAQYRRSPSARWRGVSIVAPDLLLLIDQEFEQLMPSRAEGYRELSVALGQCLKQLGSTDSQIVRESYCGAQTCRHIAERLGHTVESVRKRLQRARAQLRDCITSKIGSEVVLNG